MKILYFNNCWFTNVGEAFIDIGGMELTKRIFGDDCHMACLSAMTNYYVNNAPIGKRRLLSKDVPTKPIEFKMSDHLNADYVVIPGMVGTQEFLNAPSRKMIDKLVEKGCRPVFLGLGGEKYNQDEIEALRTYFKQIKPALIISRDDDVYKQYKDVAPCVKGVDCAFWTVDVFDPRGFTDSDYDVVTFNRSEEPEIFKDAKNVVRPWHMQYQYRKEYSNETILISDTPYDYLTVYANARKVYTDLVHATIVSLMYGTPVKYWQNGKRYKCFYALKDIEQNGEYLSVSEESLKNQKNKIVCEARKIIERT